MPIPDSFIENLLTRSDIVGVVGRYVPLKKQGANFLGLCPFHSERTPSFSVSVVRQRFHCFGCSESGDAIDFLQKHTGFGFLEAVEALAQEMGLQVPQGAITAQEREEAAKRRLQQKSLQEALALANDEYQRQLRRRPAAIEYLKGRGLDGKTCKRYGIGYAPQQSKHLSIVFNDYSTNPLLVEAGLVVVNEQSQERYDRFRGRVTFPIRDQKGKCIGFGARALGDEKPKYLNSPEGELFHKSQTLYGLYEAQEYFKSAGCALVCEGYMDVLALAQLGIGHAVATLGTACTKDHIAKLFRFTKTIVFCFDGDAAGKKAAQAALKTSLAMVNDERVVKFLFLPQEHDPDSFVREHGLEAFTLKVAQATLLEDFFFTVASNGCDLQTAQGKAQLSAQAKPMLDAVSPCTFKNLLAQRLASLVGLPMEALSSRNTRRKHYGAKNVEFRPTQAPLPVVSTSFGLDHLASLLISRSDLLEDFTNDDWSVLCGLPKPYSALFVALEEVFVEQGQLPAPQVIAALQAKQIVMPGGLNPEVFGCATKQELCSEVNTLMKPYFEAYIQDALSDIAMKFEKDPNNTTLLQRFQALQARLNSL